MEKARHCTRASLGAYRGIEVLSILTLLVCAMLLSCASPPEPESEYDRYLRLAQEVWGFQGVVLVARNDSVLVREAFGIASERDDRPHTPETRFQIGSITKSFTAIAIMQLAERGQLALDDPVRRHLNSYPPDPGDRITIRHLLTHTSGLPDYRDIPGMSDRIPSLESIDEVISLFRSRPLLFEPGTRFHRSNPGYILLGRIIESASGMRYDEFIEQSITQPLGLSSTGVLRSYATRPNCARGYTSTETGVRLPTPPTKYEVAYSTAGISSTVDDLFRLHRALYTDTLLSREYRDTLFAPTQDDYGMGFIVRTLGGHRMVGNDGGSPGFYATWQRWIDDSLCIVVLSNTGETPTEAIAEGLAGIELGERYDRPTIKQRQAIRRDQLTQFEGVYQFPNGDYQIVADVGNALIARTVDGLPYVMLPEATDLFFYAHDPLTTIAFGRDSSNAVAGLRIRRAFDVRTALRIEGPRADSVFFGGIPRDLDVETLKRFVGRYQLQPDEFVVTITLTNNVLMMSSPDREPLPMVPLSDTEFALRGLGARVVFTLDASGAPLTIEYHHGGEVIPGKPL